MLNGQQIDIPFFRHIKLMSLGTDIAVFFTRKRLMAKWTGKRHDNSGRILKAASVTRITRRANIRTPGAKIKHSKKPRIRRGFIARLKRIHTSDQWIRSDSCYVNSCRTFLAVLNFELNVLTFSQSFEAITWIAEKCTNTSLLPSAGVMKPKPLDSLNHLT